MADIMTDVGSLMAELNGQKEETADASMKPENREESSQIKEIIRDESGQMMIHFISLQEALKLQQRMELIAHEDENFEGDGVYGFVTGEHKDAALAHRFSFYQRTNGRVLKYEYK